ncbi:PQQ-binding-like beta-propeller repeat protein [Acidobacteria bacterium AH-259-G07]|nr:PQQ-binding-like beta-propeller repeat protein [Acidobacteria bacterium AH-259-G07]
MRQTPIPDIRMLKVIPLVALLAVAAADTDKVERAMFGGSPSRNMASDEKDLPNKWDPDTGVNIKWKVALGSQSYAGPVIAGGKVFVGTNNEGLRNPKLAGDRGVLMAFRESDGKFLWQAAHPKLAAGRVHDWPLQGVCSTPYVEGDRLYYISNRCEVVCLDTEGFLDGENDGPFKDETETSKIDADVVWKLDMIAELDVFPHNLAASSPLAVADLLFTLTSNGVDEDHVTIPSPFAPSFLAVNKKTGKVAWEDGSPADRILHGQWSNPAYGIIQGKAQVIFPGGDGWLYSFEPETGKLIWKFDCNPKDSVWILGGRGTRNNLIAAPVIYDDKVYIGVGQDPEHGEGIGHLWVIDGTLEGDVTERAVIWHFGDADFNRTISTVAIQDGLLYVADLSGFLYCLDAKTGKHHWTYDTFAAVWGSALVADGKIYLGDEDGDIAVLRAGKKKELIHEVNMGASVYTTPVAKNGVLYIVSRTTLFAIAEK